MSKVTIIGAGSVGATIAYSLATKLIASEIVLIDINKDKAVGEAVDISQGLPFCGPVKVHQGEYEDALITKYGMVYEKMREVIEDDTVL